MTKKSLFLLCTMLISGFLAQCTLSVTCVHTQGTASDVVDEQQTPTADISPDIKVSPI